MSRKLYSAMIDKDVTECQMPYQHMLGNIGQNCQRSKILLEFSRQPILNFASGRYYILIFQYICAT